MLRIVAIVACLCQTILYRVGYWSLVEQFRARYPLRAFIQKWESSTFFVSYDKVLYLTYLFLSSCCHKPSLLYNLNNHSLNRYMANGRRDGCGPSADLGLGRRLPRAAASRGGSPSAPKPIRHPVCLAAAAQCSSLLLGLSMGQLTAHVTRCSTQALPCSYNYFYYCYSQKKNYFYYWWVVTSQGDKSHFHHSSGVQDGQFDFIKKQLVAIIFQKKNLLE